MHASVPIISILAVLHAASQAHAEIPATLPLQGYYRPAMFMPLKVEGNASSDQIEMTGDGFVTTRAAGNATVLMLATRGGDALFVNGTKLPQPLRARPDGTRLIGCAIPQSPAPEPDTVIVMLDPLDPVPGPAIGWEALDELVVDVHGARRIGDGKLLELFAAGIAIVVPDAAQPAGSLPWRRERDAWVVRPRRFGPRNSVFAPAMLPIAGSTPGHSGAFRRNVLLGAALFAILATGIALWRPKFVALAMGVLVAVTLGSAHAWRSRQPASSVAGGSIIVLGTSFTQVDTWSYHVATRDTIFRLPAGARPVAESSDALAQVHLTLLAPDTFECRLPRGGCVATLARSLSTTQPQTEPVDPTIDSPIAPLARAGYLRPGVTIVGQVTGEPWPAIILRTSDR